MSMPDVTDDSGESGRFWTGWGSRIKFWSGGGLSGDATVRKNAYSIIRGEAGHLADVDDSEFVEGVEGGEDTVGVLRESVYRSIDVVSDIQNYTKNSYRQILNAVNKGLEFDDDDRIILTDSDGDSVSLADVQEVLYKGLPDEIKDRFEINEDAFEAIVEKVNSYAWGSSPEKSQKVAKTKVARGILSWFIHENRDELIEGYVDRFSDRSKDEFEKLSEGFSDEEEVTFTYKDIISKRGFNPRSDPEMNDDLVKALLRGDKVILDSEGHVNHEYASSATTTTPSGGAHQYNFHKGDDAKKELSLRGSSDYLKDFMYCTLDAATYAATVGGLASDERELISGYKSKKREVGEYAFFGGAGAGAGASASLGASMVLLGAAAIPPIAVAAGIGGSFGCIMNKLQNWWDGRKEPEKTVKYASSYSK